jgi:hypothetical protein
MREKKFTPGPWEVVTGDEDSNPGIDSAVGKAVVWWTDCHNEGIDNHADAHIIAAAPELLEALEMLCSLCHHELLQDCDDGCPAKAAIAKAYGE